MKNMQCISLISWLGFYHSPNSKNLLESFKQKLEDQDVCYGTDMPLSSAAMPLSESHQLRWWMLTLLTLYLSFVMDMQSNHCCEFQTADRAETTSENNRECSVDDFSVHLLRSMAPKTTREVKISVRQTYKFNRFTSEYTVPVSPETFPGAVARQPVLRI
jgi:hypothetical protein